MPFPIYQPGKPGNLIGSVPVPHGATIAAFLDLSNIDEGQVVCEVVTGGTAPTAGTVFSACKVYGNETPKTVVVTAMAGSTSLTVSDATGISPGQRILLQQATATLLGELATVTGTVPQTAPSVLTITPTLNTYSPGDGVYLIEQSPTWVVMPANTMGGWTANGDFSKTLYLSTGQWCIAANNPDIAASVTVIVSVDKVPGFA